MSAIAITPEPPYYAAIFTSLRTPEDKGYADMAERMLALASRQPGFRGVESVRDVLGITVSYWEDLQSIRNWKADTEHKEAQLLGRDLWYAGFRIRIAREEREYGM